MPLFAIYASGISGFSLADVLLVIFTIGALTYHEKNNKYSVNLNLLYIGLFLIIFNSIISMLLNQTGYEFEIITRIIRYGFYIFCFLFTSKKMVDVDLLKNAIKIVSVIATAYIFLQYLIFHLIGVNLRGFVDFLPLYTPDYATLNYHLNNHMFRPTSFFLEPAHYARYASVGIAIFLFDSKLNIGKGILGAIIVSLGVLVSTSSQGYLILTILWIAWFFSFSKINKSKAVVIIKIIMLVLSPLIAFVLFSMPFVQSTLLRALSGDFNNANTAIGARLGAYSSYLDLSPLNKIIGMGFGNVPIGEWLSSAIYWLYGAGIIAFCIYLMFMIVSICRLEGFQKYTVIIFFLLFFTDDCFYSFMLVIFMSIGFLTARENIGHHNENIIYRN